MANSVQTLKTFDLDKMIDYYNEAREFCNLMYAKKVNKEKLSENEQKNLKVSFRN